MGDVTIELLEACNAARREGADFPTIWEKVLKGHRFVAGMPVQGWDVGGPVLEVRLITGQRIRFGVTGFSIS